jgi:hypothetical protein
MVSLTEVLAQYSTPSAIASLRQPDRVSDIHATEHAAHVAPSVEECIHVRGIVRRRATLGKHIVFYLIEPLGTTASTSPSTLTTNNDNNNSSDTNGSGENEEKKGRKHNRQTRLVAELTAAPSLSLVQVIAERRWTVDLHTVCTPLLSPSPSPTSVVSTTATAENKTLTSTTTAPTATSDTDNPLLSSLTHFGMNNIIDDGDTISMVCFAARTRDARFALYARAVQLIAAASSSSFAATTGDSSVLQSRTPIKYVNAITQ